MPLHFVVLGSGSSGNATFLEADGFGLLLDVGLGPRQLSSRMAQLGLSWERVRAALLTHTHSDHWNERTFAHLLRRRIPLYCHPDHHAALQMYGMVFGKLQAAGLVQEYAPDVEWFLTPGLRCQALSIPHDGGATFGFLFQATVDDRVEALGYVADLGSWTAELAERLANVHLLALEFNHDVELEYASGRSPRLIARVLGDHGHLSNVQAAGLLQEILRRSDRGRLQHVVQLHLSRQCNHPSLAVEAAQAVLDGHATAIRLHTASQSQPLHVLPHGNAPAASPLPRRRSSVGARPPRALRPQPWLPGWDGRS